MSRVVLNQVTKASMGQFQDAVREPCEYLKFAIDPQDLTKWYVLITDIKGSYDEFVGGEYLVRIEAPVNSDPAKSFPYAPPNFYFLTENGVYKVGEKVCISIGAYHSDQYRASLGMRGFALELANGLMNWEQLGSGINIIKTSVGEKRQLARRSQDENLEKHARILDLINTSYAEYSAKWNTETRPTVTAPSIAAIDADSLFD